MIQGFGFDVSERREKEYLCKRLAKMLKNWDKIQIQGSCMDVSECGEWDARCRPRDRMFRTGIHD